MAEFKAAIEDAERRLKLSLGSAHSAIVQEAYEYRSELQRTIDEPLHLEQFDADDEWTATGETFVRSLINDRVKELSEAGRDRDASTFAALASGQATPLLHYVDSWIAEAGMKERQKIDYKRAVTKFDTWLSEARPSAAPNVEAVSIRIAGAYVTKAFAERGVNARTTNKDISCLSSYWKWLNKKGHAELNPWKGQSVKEVRAPRHTRKRPFTDAEIAILMSGDAPVYIADAMRIAALSGLRVEEIAKLRVGDVADDVFNILVAKTSAGERGVPVHSALKDIVARRCTGKQPTDFLFEELPTPRLGSPVERSQKVSKRFTDYRRRLKVDDVVNEQRQSRIDFHSFRRWFATKAADALNDGAQGYSHYAIAEVMGHSKEEMPLGMTMGVYAADGALKAMRACVEAVRLPMAESTETAP